MIPVFAFLVSLPTAFQATPCPDLEPPDPGSVVADFAPVGRYGGHWGVDVRADRGEPVRAIGSGLVTFAGPVAGRMSVTVDHGRGIRTTLSYLEAVSVRRGSRVGKGTVVGSAGAAHGIEAVHLSARIEGEYVDPRVLFSCRIGPIPDALRLVA